jgi:hypothetical protein
MIREDVGFHANVRRAHQMHQHAPAYSNGYGAVNGRAEITVLVP